MPQTSVYAGTSGRPLQVFLQDSSSTTGAGLGGLTSGSAGLTCYYKRNRDAASVAVTLASMSKGAAVSGGFVEVDSTNMKGLYDFCPPDAAMASGAESVVFYFQGATNLAPCALLVELTQWNNQSPSLHARGYA